MSRKRIRRNSVYHFVLYRYETMHTAYPQLSYRQHMGSHTGKIPSRRGSIMIKEFELNRNEKSNSSKKRPFVQTCIGSSLWTTHGVENSRAAPAPAAATDRKQTCGRRRWMQLQEFIRLARCCCPWTCRAPALAALEEKREPSTNQSAERAKPRPTTIASGRSSEWTLVGQSDLLAGAWD